ncbi:MAG: MGMT family protein [Chloracidobacterium sp.]|uniref:MGMT family protein n=1 Tax=Chloracidobacterium validum TaxID=2821543 RepID=A0ABX8B8J9_9BACT|nr:MGMT family protein [Chloracidobacterium validum]QUW03263.1 MGMT family protein [Chloracidobacterium validum]
MKRKALPSSTDEISPTLPPFEAVYAVVRQIPPGRVLTYGQISHLIGERLSAQGVGWALQACAAHPTAVPWHRVVNARGGVSTGKLSLHLANEQVARLESEGVVFRQDGTLDLSVYGWLPR